MCLNPSLDPQACQWIALLNWWWGFQQLFTWPINVNTWYLSFISNRRKIFFSYWNIQNFAFFFWFPAHKCALRIHGAGQLQSFFSSFHSDVGKCFPMLFFLFSYTCLETLDYSFPFSYHGIYSICGFLYPVSLRAIQVQYLKQSLFPQTTNCFSFSQVFFFLNHLDPTCPTSEACW